MIKQLPNINDARWAWLNARNPDLMADCHFMLMRLIEMQKHAEDWWTDYFEVKFSGYELKMFSKYMDGMGYKFEIKTNEVEGPWGEAEIRIGI